MSLVCKLSRQAAEDFADIATYTLTNYGAELADDYTDSMEHALALLSCWPEMGRQCPEIREGVRRMDVRRHTIFYRIRATDFFVIRILHQEMTTGLHL